MANHDGSGPHAAKVYVPRLLSTSDEPSSSHVLSECAIRQLAPQVPRRYALSDWRLLYSTHVHGISINTLYLRASGCGGCLLALRSSDGATFGGFISECQPPSAPGPDGRHFFGNGESFLWRVEPLTDLPPLPRPSMGEPPTCLLETFGWTGANTYFALSHREHLALGSGGHFGLWIDGDLRHGSSGPSDTYGNPSLCAPPPELYHHSERNTGSSVSEVPAGGGDGGGGGGAEAAALSRSRRESSSSSEFVCDVLEVWGVDGHAIKRRNAELLRRGVAP